MHILSPAPSRILRREATSDIALRMAEAATAFAASLSRDQLEICMFPFESEERFVWDYRPRDRKGLSLKEMSSSQRKLALALLAGGLSRQSNAKALAILSLESILGKLEGPNRTFPRDSDLYFISIFGTPGEEGPWAWRAEGHHLSVNHLILDKDQIASTPNFFGVNPARVPTGNMAGWRILAPEEDLARRLLESLAPEQRTRAIIRSEAPADILSDNDRRVSLDDPEGLSFADMNDHQQDRCMELVCEYVGRVPRPLAEMKLEKIDKEGKGYIHFAWAGSGEPGKPHYYRLQGTSFLVEYDNTQNNANHIHSVWRDMAGDWGDDLLKEHYKRSHC